MQRPGASKSIDERASILRVFEGWKCGVKKSINFKNLKNLKKSVNFGNLKNLKKIEKSVNFGNREI